uniref:Serine/threonine-protein kinase ULK3 n=1 Tax=Arion vulgaris TaxID=1028688 RepID=A0A0B6ZPW0_9EUPU
MSSKPSSANAVEAVAKPSLSQYVFAEKLGSGTYATVYKAYRKSGIREVVAIKCVLKSSLNKASTENLLTEIELLKNLKHEHIVTLKDFQWDTSYIYLIMEYCSGGDLSRFIRSKRALPEPIVKRFVQQIALAIKFLWDNNVAHMDLKPQNILLTSSSSSQLKLADFGFAKHLYDGDCLHAMRGSPLYMAPEIICDGTYDNRVDLWSIGVILYECLFGKAPFASKSFKELGEKIWNQKPVEIPQGFNVSDNARDLTLQLLQRNPSDRITFEEFFAHPFIDMEHIPSENSLPNAIKIISEAVAKDENGDYKTAVRLYCEALEHFMPAVHYEKSFQKKESLRAKVKQYMNRAETLKQLMKTHLHSSPAHYNASKRKPSSINSNSTCKADSDTLAMSQKLTDEKNIVKTLSNTIIDDTTKNSESSCSNGIPVDSAVCTRSFSNDALEELMTMCADSQELVAVLKLINAALIEEQKEDFERCLHYYEVALGGLLKILPCE